MRTIKIIIWIFALYILQTVFGGVIGICGVVPELLLAFSVIFAFNTHRYSVCTYVMLVCGILTGSCVGSTFAADVLIIGAASVGARELSEYAKSVSRFVRAEAVVLAAAMVHWSVEYFIDCRTFIPNFGLMTIYGIYTMACACIMYPMIMKTLFPKEKKKMLVV